MWNKLLKEFCLIPATDMSLDFTLSKLRLSSPYCGLLKQTPKPTLTNKDFRMCFFSLEFWVIVIHFPEFAAGGLWAFLNNRHAMSWQCWNEGPSPFLSTSTIISFIAPRHTYSQIIFTLHTFSFYRQPCCPAPSHGVLPESATERRHRIQGFSLLDDSIHIIWFHQRLISLQTKLIMRTLLNILNL